MHAHKGDDVTTELLSAQLEELVQERDEALAQGACSGGRLHLLRPCAAPATDETVTSQLLLFAAVAANKPPARLPACAADAAAHSAMRLQEVVALMEQLALKRVKEEDDGGARQVLKVGGARCQLP